MTKRSITAMTLTGVALLFTAMPAGAEIIVSGGQTDHTIVQGALEDVRLGFSLIAQDGYATVTFRNLSAGAETSAVFKEIVLDGVDNDTGTVILSGPAITGGSAGVNYTIGSSGGVPGYKNLVDDTMFAFNAKSSPVKNGLAPGLELVVRFATTLADGSNENDYMSALGGGNDTPQYALGFHAISAAIVNGQSLSGMSVTGEVPEPATATILLAGGMLLALRRKRAF